ncbi:MAG: phosphoglycerate dehydrogenase [Clostridia bacterium]|nr:phosphoglycerate dehydrogenase [Clostridia bacterium]MBR3553796.1 phosphoglycerate dehydrogenase [Clostridia bacterium]
MENILTLNKISKNGLARLDQKRFVAGDDVTDPVGIIVRSAAMHDMDLPESLLAIARAGAGVNNIPIDKCSERGIVVFNTPGANANAVKELVLAGLLISSRKVISGIEWAKTLKGEGEKVGKLVEKGKSAFAGGEIMGKKLGVIGLGAIGALVANDAQKLGMEVYGYDPYLSADAAWKLSPTIHKAQSISEVYAKCDYITLHLPLLPSTKNMINADALAQMKDGVRIMNFARGGLVHGEDIKAALSAGKVAAYVVDFPDDDMLDVENVIAIPHLGASTPESEENCAVMAVKELQDYIKNGNILHSVNYPDVSMPRSTAYRICVLHRNIPDVLSQLSGAFAGNNIESQSNRSKGDYAYTIIDLDNAPTEENLERVKAIEGFIRMRMI